jgi:hypothetical protein
VYVELSFLARSELFTVVIVGLVLFPKLACRIKAPGSGLGDSLPSYRSSGTGGGGSIG